MREHTEWPPCAHSRLIFKELFLFHYFLKIVFIYLRQKGRTGRGAEGDGETDSLLGVPLRAPSWDPGPGTMTSAEGRRLPASAPRGPSTGLFYIVFVFNLTDISLGTIKSRAILCISSRELSCICVEIGLGRERVVSGSLWVPGWLC